MKIAASAKTGQELHAILPAGSYYLGDPCYVLTRETYGQLLRLRDDEHPIAEDSHFLVETDQGRMLVWGTAFGDGSYPVYISGMDHTIPEDRTLAVDTGTLAIIDERLIDRSAYTPQELAVLGARFTLMEPLRLTVTKSCNLDGGNLDCALHVRTNDTDPDDDEPDYDDEDEE